MRCATFNKVGRQSALGIPSPSPELVPPKGDFPLSFQEAGGRMELNR
jgi:hypothetical protein